MMQRFKYVENNEIGLDVYFDRHKEQHYVEIPHTHTGWGSGTIERANNIALGRDSERCGQMNIDEQSDVSGSQLVAIVDNYTSEQWELLAELITELEDYPIYDDILFTGIEGESQLEAIDRMLPYDAEVEAEAVLHAIFELGLYFVEEEGENWYITEQDLSHAIQYAIRNKL